MPNHDIVVIGASAGGVEALREIVPQLATDLQAAIFVTVHVAPQSTGLLPKILNRRSKIRAHLAKEGETIRPGEIYVARPDYHLLLEPTRVRVVNGPKHNRHRPAIDLLFRTAAKSFGPRVIGVVLTGFLEDGSAGLAAIKKAGGIAIVQSPEDAEVASMPRSALQQVDADYCVPLTDIAPLLNRLTQTEVTIAMESIYSGNGTQHEPEKSENQTSFTCPECSGILWEVTEDGEMRFECRVGHSYSLDDMSEAADETVERSLWVALRVLEESATIEQRLANIARQRNRPHAQKIFTEKAHARKQHALVLREFLLGTKRRQTEADGDMGKQEMKQVS
jgi:two-component system chemotaxis response regulator CheB